MNIEKEFECVKFQIKFKNWIEIMGRLSKFIKDDEFMKTGVEPDDTYCYVQAQEQFALAKKAGIYDELNFRVESEI